MREALGHDTARILVVDDDEAVRSAYEVALSPARYIVHAAADAGTALELLSRQRVDLMFVDLKMPQVNGLELLREIRREDRITPVFIVTAFAEEFMLDLRRAAAEGLDFNLLRKPLDIEEIQAAACAALGRTVRKGEGGWTDA